MAQGDPIGQVIFLSLFVVMAFLPAIISSFRSRALLASMAVAFNIMALLATGYGLWLLRNADGGAFGLLLLGPMFLGVVSSLWTVALVLGVAACAAGAIEKKLDRAATRPPSRPPLPPRL